MVGSPPAPVPGDVVALPGDGWDRGDVVLLAVATAVVVTTTALAVRGTSAAEAEIFGWMNAPPDWLFGPVWVVMQLGTIGVAAVVGVATGYALRRPVLALIFAVTPVVAWFAARMVKNLVDRGRPAAEGLAVTIRGTADDGFGFVSGHSAVAFALATVTSPYLPGRWRIAPFVLASAVAVSRPYVGVHLPLDIVGGAALGIVVGVLAHGLAVVLRPGRWDRGQPDVRQATVTGSEPALPLSDRESLISACTARIPNEPVDRVADRLLMRIARRRKWALHRHVHLVAAFETANARRPVTSVLSIGSSAGLSELFLAAMHPSVRFHLTDVDDELLDRAVTTGTELGLTNVTFGLVDLLTPRTVPRHDLVVCIEVLEHIADDETATRNLVDHAEHALYVLVPFCSEVEATDPGRTKWAWEVHEHHRVGYTHEEFGKLIGDRPTLFHRNCYFMPAAGELRRRLADGADDDLVAQRVDLTAEATDDIADRLVTGDSLDAEAIEALIDVSCRT